MKILFCAHCAIGFVVFGVFLLFFSRLSQVSSTSDHHNIFAIFSVILPVWAIFGNMVLIYISWVNQKNFGRILPKLTTIYVVVFVVMMTIATSEQVTLSWSKFKDAFRIFALFSAIGVFKIILAQAILEDPKDKTEIV